MIEFIAKRFIQGFFVMIGVIVIVFALFKYMPDPARLTMGQRADVSSIEAIMKEEYLDQPVHKQFLYYLNDISPISVYEQSEENQKKYEYSVLFSVGSGNAIVAKFPYLRRSYQTKRKVSEILLEALPVTIILGMTSIILASIIGIFLGVIAALKQFTWWDNSILVTSILGISQPSYFSGVVLAIVFGYWLADWTGLSHTGSLFEVNDYGEDVIVWKNLILPAIALGIRPVAIIVQLTRGSMIEVMSQDFVRTAYAKGLGKYTVIFKHALRNALNPVVTTISGWFASILAGAYFIEIIFDFKGLGYVTINALNNLDFPVAMGSVLFTAAVFVVVNIFVDMIYGFLDPRISLKK